MSDTKQPLDLSTLETDYTIIGELGGTGPERVFTATKREAGSKRRDDSPGVLITVVTTPPGDEGNALSHLAADTKTLAAIQHRRLMPVLEGRWIGDDAFAIITPRTSDQSLAEKLAIGEAFSNPRTAAILREVNGILEWARDQGVVHRSVTPDRLYLEQGTDRVRVTFGVAPIQRVRKQDAESQDARSIVQLGMAMLTGTDDPQASEKHSLADLRPDLPVRLCEATTSLLDDEKSHSQEEVAAFIGLVGMADPIAVGENEAGRIRAEVLEEQRAEREKLANERAEFERVMAEERAAFAAAMAGERAVFTQEMEEAREQLANHKAELVRAAEFERASIVAKRAELERAVALQRAQIEQVAAEDRRRIEELRLRLKTAGELEIERKRDAALEEVTDDASVLDGDEFVSPEFVAPVIAPLEALVFDDDNALMRDGDFELAPAESESVAGDAPAAPPPKKRRKWFTAGALILLVVVTGASALVLRNRGSTSARPASATQTSAGTIAKSAPVAPSAPLSVAVPLPAVVDSASRYVVDSLAPRPVARRKPRPVVVDSSALSQDSFPVFRADTAARRDTVIKPDTRDRA